MTTVRALTAKELDGPAAIPEQLRKLAQDIESGKQGARTLQIVIDTGENTIDCLCFGYRPRWSESMGQLTYAQHMLYEQIGKDE